MKNKMKRVFFEVSLDLPEGATVQGAAAYVSGAVREYCGSMIPPPGADTEDPDYSVDPMAYLDTESVRVRHLRKA
jgi:hypothetical protein